ncbi:hypothetical protein KUCAC02_019942 [Chaenocephalus aceratus]|uniref:Uncharacterized protein n=1 Tax=Chaenocephalus aceratus TaxID=36190 RepID=A0ACB9VQA1_CHAAC|nr:hypothetical protein KUCAC02_019942 [Chaenocephalus aceratus]
MKCELQQHHLPHEAKDLFSQPAVLKGTEPVEDVTEQIRTVKIEDTKNYRQRLLMRGPPKFKKAVLKKGDKTNFPKKGERTGDEGILTMSKGETSRLEI